MTQGGLLLAALAFTVFAGVLSKDQDRYEEVVAKAIPAKATLRVMDVKEWIEGQDNWSAFGKFDVVADGPRGTLEGDLARAEDRTRGKRSREKAEALRDRWKIGETYDGFWNPDRPLTVFFREPDAIGNARWVLILQILGAVTFLAAIFSNRRSRRI